MDAFRLFVVTLAALAFFSVLFFSSFDVQVHSRVESAAGSGSANVVEPYQHDRVTRIPSSRGPSSFSLALSFLLFFSLSLFLRIFHLSLVLVGMFDAFLLVRRRGAR